jgi:hypothetical protein
MLNTTRREGFNIGASIETLRSPGIGNPRSSHCRVLGGAADTDVAPHHRRGSTNDRPDRGRRRIAKAGRIARRSGFGRGIACRCQFAVACRGTITGRQTGCIARRGCTADD